jgi:hypothetical protein
MEEYKVMRFFITNGNLTHAYLASNAVSISEQLTSTTLLVREMFGESLS